MSVIRVASTYAKSLLDLAIEQKQLKEVHADMELLEASMASRDLFLMLKSPIINKDKKRKALNAVFGEKLSKMSNGFLDIVLRKGRENVLPEIVKSFNDQYKTFKQITSVTLITAEELTEASLNEIKAKLLDSSLTSKNIEIETKVDPSIIGGFIIEMGDRLYDASIAHQMQKLRKEFSVNDFVKAY